MVKGYIGKIIVSPYINMFWVIERMTGKLSKYYRYRGLWLIGDQYLQRVSVDMQCMALNCQFSQTLFFYMSNWNYLDIEMYLFKLEIVFVLLVSVDTEFMAPNQQFSKAFTSDWDKKFQSLRSWTLNKFCLMSDLILNISKKSENLDLRFS